ncbi:MAG: carboxypeptidase-like regulatory domain-containing protein, partial [Ignavibacteriae bacterium]|nr:carboxypeptidase-like regulatory domain-containing protein [Ignavibacteriota bacterium]
MRKLILILLILSLNLVAQDIGKIQGKIVDLNTKDPLPGVNVILEGTYYGAATDFDGNYTIDNITSGKYTVRATLIGFKQMKFTGIEIAPNKTTQLDIKMEETVLTMDQDVIVVGEKPLVDAEETQSVKSIGRDE